MDASQQELVAQFCGVTGAAPSVAQSTLESTNWNLSEATSLFFEAQEGESDEDAQQPSSTAVSSQAPVAAAAAAQPSQASSSSRRPPQNTSRLRTLQDLQPTAHDDDDEDDRDPDLFAGGEKSGLAVQNPGSGGRSSDHFRNILNQAKANRDRPPSAEDEEDVQGSGNFAGRAQTLGGDDAPSRVIEDPSGTIPGQQSRAERINRTLHLWRDGVSVDDGPLFRFDDPANEHIMQAINRGQAPRDLLDVQINQEVDLTLEPHKDQDYVQPKKKYKAFSGQGQRLGSPVPGVEAAPAMASTSTPAQSSAPQPAAATNAIDVDDSQPTVSLQVRLGDGTRLTSRFNTTHTIGDVYSYVDRSQGSQRSYVLMTTFPSKELSDRSQSLGDLPDFKRGGVVVQKWT